MKRYLDDDEVETKSDENAPPRGQSNVPTPPRTRMQKFLNTTVSTGSKNETKNSTESLVEVKSIYPLSPGQTKLNQHFKVRKQRSTSPTSPSEVVCTPFLFALCSVVSACCALNCIFSR